MKFHIQVVILLVLTIFFLTLLTNVAQADHEYDYLSDRLSREHRDAGDVEDWIERGNATVTASPRFEDGIRLAAWASGSDKKGNYEFAIASAIYLFEIPRQAQYIEILVRYRGEPHKSDFEDYEEIAGRVWIRNTKREYSRQRYDDENEEETLYGNTFVLRAKRRSETIKIATAGHVDNDLLEMHIVAEDGEQLGIEYIDVSTYRRQPDVRVVHRYARDYRWRPWHRYTYLYFYDGPFYYCTDLGYYIRWSYPIYDHHYLSIRYAYGDYLHHYYRRYPDHYYRSYSNNVHVHVDNAVKTQRRLNRWTATHETTRREYTRSRLSTTSSKTNKANVQTRVRSLIRENRREPVLADRVIQRATVSRKRRRIDAEVELNTAIKGQRDFSRSIDDASTRSYRATQEILKHKRYSSGRRDMRSRTESRLYPYDRFQLSTKQKRYSSDQEDTRSNAERRARLYNRSRSSASRPSAAPSRSQSPGLSSGTNKRKHSSSSSSRRQKSTTPQAPQASSSSSSQSDDDEEKDRNRNTTRTQKRKRRN
jgi:hypothetical protein